MVVDQRWFAAISDSPAFYNTYDTTWRMDDVCDANAWRWIAKAACSGMDPDGFFETETRADRDYLARICVTCPVKKACLDYAIANDEHGWWGGTSRNQRLKMRRAA